MCREFPIELRKQGRGDATLNDRRSNKAETPGFSGSCQTGFDRRACRREGDEFRTGLMTSIHSFALDSTGFPSMKSFVVLCTTHHPNTKIAHTRKAYGKNVRLLIQSSYNGSRIAYELVGILWRTRGQLQCPYVQPRAPHRRDSSSRDGEAP